MKTQTKVFALFASIAISLTLSCSKEQTTDPQQVENFIQNTAIEISSFKKMSVDEVLDKMKQFQNTSRVPITYEGELFSGMVETGTVPDNGNFDPSLGDYWYFNGNAGDLVFIDVNRISCDMDPLLFVWEGDGGGDTDNLINMVGFGDDDDPADCEGGGDPDCFSSDPQVELTLQTSGVYTIFVFDLGNPGECGPGPQDYSIVMTVTPGNSDADGDGCNDDVDPHPNSILEEFVIIDGCDSGVANAFITQCSTMLDLIADCAATASDHGDFVSCVSQLTNEWKSAGFIVGSEKGDILSCAGQSNIPY